jgi:hypothetical protein
MASIPQGKSIGSEMPGQEAKWRNRVQSRATESSVVTQVTPS